MSNEVINIHRKNILGTTCFVKKYKQMPDTMVIPQIREILQQHYNGDVSTEDLEGFMRDVEYLFNLICTLNKERLSELTDEDVQYEMLKKVAQAEKAYEKNKAAFLEENHLKRLAAEEILSKAFEEMTFMAARFAGTRDINTHQRLGNSFRKVIGAVYFSET